MKPWLIALLVLAAVATLVVLDRRGRPEEPGEVTRRALPKEWVAQRAQQQVEARAALEAPPAKQVLFGDLHVHTTYSVDAFAWSMPLFHGEGVHPPAEACDYARYCSDLDFWASTEHAESLTPRHWRDIKETVRQCNAVAGDPQDPDLVSFAGWEWTQMGDTAAEHYGHKNVIFREDAEDRLPTRPISAGGMAARAMRNANLPLANRLVAPYLDFSRRQSQFDQQYKMDELAAQPMCPDGDDERAKPADCVEYAETPHDLFRRLDEWGFDSMVIPHGNAWGFYTPPGSSWDKQLTAKQHDPERQKLIEVFSGHGNSEEYRGWREAEYDGEGRLQCPEPTTAYLPSCWRAGELVRARCAGLPAEECERRVAQARRDYLEAGRGGHLVVPGVTPQDWLDAGQCRDCYLPAFNYRPKSSTQYALALSNFDEPGADGQPLRFRFGFIASSDNHAAQPGTGYKEILRHKNTEVFGQEGFFRESYIDKPKPVGSEPRSVPFELAGAPFNFMQIVESERVQSYFYTGGLVAVHSAGRSRDAIWDALQRREVYGTSGERMLLWFDLLAADGEHPMGSELKLSGTPRFRVRAVGGFEQLPGCPEHSLSGLPAERLQKLCAGECYNPSARRKPIDRIEVVRIRPQATRGEAVGPLIEDPWRTLACGGEPAGCTVEFEDPEYAAGARETIYYVRALERPTPTINAGTLRCEKDEAGACVNVDPCFGDSRTGLTEDCAAPAAERAWSSPIFLRP